MSGAERDSCLYRKTVSKEAERRREQCSTELGRQLEIVVGEALPTGMPNIVTVEKMHLLYSV